MEDKLDLILKEISSLHAKIDIIEDKLDEFYKQFASLSNDIIDRLDYFGYSSISDKGQTNK